MATKAKEYRIHSVSNSATITLPRFYLNYSTAFVAACNTMKENPQVWGVLITSDVKTAVFIPRSGVGYKAFLKR
jgi:hypothetical protein